jgi:pantoate--beta-alanine ligase
MREIKTAKEMRSFSGKTKSHGKKIAFVPTMGALHEGHLSLVAEAKKQADVVVVSIFINPIQFGPNEDLARYPRNPRRDKKLLKNLGVDVLFAPSSAEMYPAGFKTFVEVESLSQRLCGRSRQNHFRGVTTVVAKLFTIISPDLAFFGQKDFQQQLIIKRMARDLNLAVQIISLPTIREYDGLALSSRNAYLSPAERKSAAVLYRTLMLGKEMARGGEMEAKKIIARMRTTIFSVPGLRLDYLVIVDAETLDEVEKIKSGCLIAVAAYLGKTRLIDNLII